MANKPDLQCFIFKLSCVSQAWQLFLCLHFKFLALLSCQNFFFVRRSLSVVLPFVQQNQENKQKVENGGNTVMRERVIEKPAQEQPKPKKEEEDSW